MARIGQAGDKFYEEAALEELSRWPGVSVSFLCASKHAVALLSFQGTSRKAFYPMTPSDSRGALNFQQDIRRLLREMGAVRSPLARSQRPKGKKVRHSAISPDKPLPSQSQDLWLEPLKALKEAMERQ